MPWRTGAWLTARRMFILSTSWWRWHEVGVWLLQPTRGPYIRHWELETQASSGRLHRKFNFLGTPILSRHLKPKTGSHEMHTQLLMYGATACNGSACNGSGARGTQLNSSNRERKIRKQWTGRGRGNHSQHRKKAQSAERRGDRVVDESRHNRSCDMAKDRPTASTWRCIGSPGTPCPTLHTHARNNHSDLLCFLAPFPSLLLFLTR